MPFNRSSWLKEWLDWCSAPRPSEAGEVSLSSTQRLSNFRYAVIDFRVRSSLMVQSAERFVPQTLVLVTGGKYTIVPSGR